MISAWSPSRIFKYEECPAALKYRTIDKLPEAVGEPLIRGGRIHAEGEAYLKAKKSPKTPESFAYVEKELRALRKQKAVSEERWGFDADWNPIGWFDATIRMVLDARALLGTTKSKIVDFKTGRPRAEKDESQVGLYAVGAFAMFPNIRTVIGQLWYLDIGEIVELRFNRKEAEAERKAWQKRADRMIADEEMAPTPGYFCKWCSFGISKGGPCKAEKP